MGEEEESFDTRGRPHIVRPESIPSAETFGTSIFWLSYCFAPEWLSDALNEARIGRDHNARRREILFAVCFAESYLVEWVRDEVLKRDFNRFNDFFPPGKWQGVIKKWMHVPKKLPGICFVSTFPDPSRSYWKDWLKLVCLRNGLVHARASRAETNPQPQLERPLPSKGFLDRLEAGWATRVVVTLVQELHKAVGTQVPRWLNSL